MISWFTSNNDNDAAGQFPDFVTSKKYEKIVKLLSDNANKLTNDSLVKIVRQLNFWVKEENDLSESELIELTEKLIHISTWRNRQKDSNEKNKFKCPTVRFGRTELQMPIITCGTMRFQHTWMPDFVPILGSSKSSVIKTPSQANLTEVVRQCMKMGINHFETCRMYGTSEIQLCEALKTLIDNGEIKRSDFILQTKIPVRGPDREGFEKFFQQSWKIFGDTLGHIDLVSFWCTSTPDQIDWMLGDDDDKDTELMIAAKQWKKDGKIKHIGFSTHGSAEIIMRFIESNKFDYVNLHYHFFGSYHAQGTPDTVGGHGNRACVKRALELDMGVFNISPVDKGGQLYMPSSRVARLIGPKLSPIAFSCLHTWEIAKMHTVSIGFARPEDLEEALDAAEMFASIQNGTNIAVIKPLLEGCEKKLMEHAKEKLGKEWYEKGLINVPSFFDGDKFKGINGIAIGHILWCYNMIHGYGMYDTAKARYQALEKSNKWNVEKSYEDNMKAMQSGNPGRSYIADDDDLTVALSNHYDPKLVLKKMKEVHELCSGSKEAMSNKERTTKEWDAAYDLRPWNEYPDLETIMKSTYLAIVQNTTIGSFYYSGGGPTKKSIQKSEQLRNVIVQRA